MKRFIVGLVVLAACQSPETSPALAELEIPTPPGSDFEGPAFEFERVSEDVYQARGTGNVSVGSNASIVINEEDVLVVDSHVSPAAAAALMRELRLITDKPVKYVVNSHFHFDHAHGNQIYGDDVEIIGHESTRDMLANGESVSGHTYQTMRLTWVEQAGFAEGQQELAPIPPNRTLSDRMTIYRGGREIQLHFFGRAHTGGDVLVYLPVERGLMPGDMLLARPPNMGDGFPEEWVETLERVKELEFDTILPGHGPPFTDVVWIDRLQEYLRDFWARVGEAHQAGLTSEEAATRVDLSDHGEHYTGITGPGGALAAVERAYALLEGR